MIKGTAEIEVTFQDNSKLSFHCHPYGIDVHQEHEELTGIDGWSHHITGKKTLSITGTITNEPKPKLNKRVLIL